MIRFGSARIDENGRTRGGKAGDQTGSEVAMQNYYMHKKGWYCLRPKSVDHANKLAKAMTDACKNDNIGYNQDKHSQVVDVDTEKKKDTDCSGLVRACILEATGIDVGNFNTATEVDTLTKSELFEPKFKVKAASELRDGDVLVTCTKGHTVIVVSGNPRETQDARKGYSGEWPKLPGRGWFQNGDVSAEVIKLKKFLNWYGNYKLSETNKNYFDKTAAAVRDFQSKEKLSADGLFGPASLLKAKTIKK